MFFKKKKINEDKEKINIYLCNRYIQTTEQIKKALLSDKNLNINRIDNSQFPWAFEDDARKIYYDILFIDYVTDTNKNLGRTIKRIKNTYPNLTIIVLTNAYTNEITDWVDGGWVNQCLLMPFQQNHIITAVRKYI